jgi:alkyldihydroxyacetonephosphate synthase
MRRWNGWGDDTILYPLPPGALEFLEARIGRAKPPRDASFEEVVRKVPTSNLAAHPLVSFDEADRVRHARGQSFPDWLALRAGTVHTFPDGVAHPSDDGEVQALLDHARAVGAHVIPYGGGTSVVGHINPLPGEKPVLTIHLDRLASLRDFDEGSHLATFGAGVCGPDLEQSLRSRGFTLGHYPQSFEYATLGGWVATRSSGQESARHGRIEQLFAGGKVLTPRGVLELAPFPASAAGPDLREMVLGSEGRLGIITEATVRIRPRPEREWFRAVFFPEWSDAFAAARQIAQERIAYAMVRVSTPKETETMLALAGHKHMIGALEWALSMRGADKHKCMMMLGLVGNHALASQARREALAIARSHRGIHVGRLVGDSWVKNRFRAPYLRNSLWDAGFAIDTLETATTWDHVPNMVEGIEHALQHALDDEGEKIHVFTHLSHVYPTGSSVYTTYVFRLAEDPDATLARWKKMKHAASQAIVDNHGTISHQHGVGLDHIPYLTAEKGELGMGALRSIMDYWDPDRLMNPGKLF